MTSVEGRLGETYGCVSLDEGDVDEVEDEIELRGEKRVGDA